MSASLDLAERPDTSERRNPRPPLAPLWCPLLTPYGSDGAIDLQRLRRHVEYLTPSVGGFLVPGSTGDGWVMSDAQALQLLDAMLDLAQAGGAAVLVGVLRPDVAAMQATMACMLDRLRRRAGTDDAQTAMRRASVQGFTFCAPHGADLSQDAIAGAFDSLLGCGLPVSLYQLPQVTGNEVAPATVRALATRHANLHMVKDTSGADRIADAGLDDVFLLRGAEGAYSRHLKIAGGRYDGFLLSSANGFGPQLAQMIDLLRQGRRAQADAMSARIEAVVEAVFAAAAGIAFGNVFTHANKAIDHHMAFGPLARDVAAPRLHGGQTLPDELIAVAGDALARHGLMPARGYLYS